MNNILKEEMSKRKLYLILLLEGYVSVAVQIIMMRQLVPFVGSSVVVSSLVIGIFLLFLSLGYKEGGKIKNNHIKKLFINLSISSILLIFSLSYNFMNFMFSKLSIINNPVIEVSIYLLLFMSPVVFLLGQTIPILTNFNKKENISEITGDSLFLSTVGSVLGSIVTALFFMNYVGVANTIIINSVLLCFLMFLLYGYKSILFIIISISLNIAYNFNSEKNQFQLTNAYNNYAVKDGEKGTYMIMNNSFASAILKDGSNWEYINKIKEVFFKQMNIKNKDILILGAGGFTLSFGDDVNVNNFTYVDIDKEIKSVAETYFLRDKINGEFIAQDARVFVNRTKEEYDAVVVDLYSDRTSIPWHVLTTEFISDVKGVLKENGIVAFNIISNSFFEDDYSRTIYNTIKNNFNYCYSIPVKIREKETTNIVYFCKKESNVDNLIYKDDKSRLAIDELNSVK